MTLFGSPDFNKKVIDILEYMMIILVRVIVLIWFLYLLRLGLKVVL